MVLDLLKRATQRIRFSRSEPGIQWRTPAALDRGALGESCMALDGQGQGLALWENGGEIWSMPVGPRTSPSLMRLPLAEGTAPRIVLNREGRGIVLWQGEAAGERQILGKIIGGGESMAHVLFRTVGQNRHLQAAVDRRGNALVVWLHEKDGRCEVMAHSYDTRGQLDWRQEAATLGMSTDLAVEPRIAVNYREHAMVLWQVQNSVFEGLVASHYWPLDRIWSDRPVPVVSHLTRQHQVVMDDLGNALALWIHAPHGQRTTLEASFYDAQQSEWSDPEVLGVAHDFSSLKLVMSGEGEALAAWCQGEGHGSSRLFAKVFINGRWEARMECLELGRTPVRDFDIDLGPDGQAGLLAVQSGPEGDSICALFRKEEWSAPMQLAPASKAPRSSPRLRFCPQGASALWIQGEGREKALLMTETR